MPINGEPVQADQQDDARAQRLVEREFNLSHAAQMPDHNLLVGGRWVAEEPGAISVEEGLAETLGLKLGDTLRFDVAGQLVDGRITSLRKVDWGSMRVNFFVMFPTATMADVPVSYIAAFRAPTTAAVPASRRRRRPPSTTGSAANFRISPMSTSRRRSRRCSACSTR